MKKYVCSYIDSLGFYCVCEITCNEVNELKKIANKFKILKIRIEK